MHQNQTQMHFSWDAEPPRLVVTGDTVDFDPTTIQHFKDEGFGVSYLPFNGAAKDYKNELQMLADPLESGDKYAIVGTLACSNSSNYFFLAVSYPKKKELMHM